MPAFPKVTPDGDLLQNGLTKREYFAGLVMQGLVAAKGYGGYDGKANDSVKAADELLRALEK